MTNRAAGVALLATAAGYAALGVVARQTGLVGVGLTVVGWGTAVLAVREGPLLVNREAAALLVGVGAGLLAAYVVAVRCRFVLHVCSCRRGGSGI